VVIQERTDISLEQQELLKEWLRSHVSEHIPLPKSPVPPAPAKVDPVFTRPTQAAMNWPTM
jgi:hypothetical protein